MRTAANPSYKHSPELIQKFNRYKDSIFYKDYTQYTKELLTVTLNSIEECKKSKISNKYILWLTERIYKSKLTLNSLKEEYMPLIKFHFNNKDLLKSIDSYLNVYELNADIKSLKEKSEFVSEKELDIFFEKDGWILAMPHTTKASCLLGKDTDWCTARTKSQNLFLSYVGNIEGNNILFYLIKIDGNPKKNPNDKLSVGFRNRVPIFGGESASSTVNALNEILSIEEFGQILGKELAQIMLIKMDEKSQSIEGKHPAKKEMERIAKSVDKYMKKISEFKNEDELNNFKVEIARYDISKDMQMLLSNDEYKDVRSILAANPNLIESIQIKLANDEDEEVRRFLALNPILIKSLQIKLADDEEEWVRRYLAQNPNLIESLQIKLANDENEEVRSSLAQNDNLFESVQLKLADDENKWVKIHLAQNPNLIESVQLKLADDEYQEVRENLAQNPNLFGSAQSKLANSDDESVKIYLAKNPNIIIYIQLKLASENLNVRNALDKNTNIHKTVKNILKSK